MATRAKKIVVKKKKWVTINAPQGFGVLGESYVEDPATLKGRMITANLMTLTNDPKKRRYSVSFVVKQVDGSTAKAKLMKFSVVPSSVKVMIRKNKDRIDHRFTIKKEGVTLIVKPLMITRANTTHAVHTALRKKCEELIKSIKGSPDELLQQAAQMKIQRDLKRELSTIFPLQLFEFKVLEVKA